MASSDAEIKDGFNIPVWMKTKPTRDFENFAASPPGPDDAFFIRYPNTKALFGTNEREVSKILREPTAAVKDKDWSKHTKPCQDVLHGIAPINTAANPVSPKVLGTEDEFKEGAACGNSVLKVAHQMISSTRSPRGFTVASPEEEDAVAPDARYNLAARRGSKSLPVTPVHSPPGSPNSRRRRHHNRFFTSPFEPADDAAQRSWLSMALLGFKKDLTASTSTLAEEDALEARLHGPCKHEQTGPHRQHSFTSMTRISAIASLNHVFGKVAYLLPAPTLYQTVQVAHQMISSTRSPRGFTVASPEEEDAVAPDARYNLAARRGSKSLPVTPVHSPPGSPNSRRRRHHNRFFTSPFEPADDAAQRSWLSMALLGFKKDLTASTSTLAEEDALEARLHGSSLAESVESLGPMPRARAPAPAAFRAKPSELREMNFWSPTSM